MDILTFDDLVNYCRTNEIYTFSAKEKGDRIVVSMPATFEESKEASDSRMLYGTVRLFHTGENFNGSEVTDEAALKVLPSIKYKPLLANFTNVNGEPDFTTHDVKEEIGPDGKKKRVYLEHQIGCFTAKEPFIQYDEEYDRNFVCAEAAIPRQYTDAAAIIERKGGTKVSAELGINEFSFDKDKGRFIFSDIDVVGCTCLGVNPKTGKEIGEGMKGSRFDLQDFSEKNNVIATYSDNQKLIEVLENLNQTLSHFDISNNSKKGGSTVLDKFNELLAKYNKTAEDVTFDYENLSDEELEKAFATAFETSDLDAGQSDTADNGAGAENGTGGANDNDNDNTGDNAGQDNDGDNGADNGAGENTDQGGVVAPDKVSVTLSDGSIKEFSMSLNDIDRQLHQLVNDTYATEDAWYSVEVYPEENKVVFRDYESGKSYRQTYAKVDDEKYALVGDRVSVHSAWLTEDEEEALNSMKASFEEMKSKLATYETAENTAKKSEMLASTAYAAIKDTDEVKAIVGDEAAFAALTAVELGDKLDKIVLEYAKSGKLNFAQIEKETAPKTTPKKGLPIRSMNTNSRYGGIFRNHNN